MTVERHKSFVNDFKKVRIADKQFDKFISYISLLKNNKSLPAEAKDHKLQGNFAGYRVSFRW